MIKMLCNEFKIDDIGFRLLNSEIGNDLIRITKWRRTNLKFSSP